MYVVVSPYPEGSKNPYLTILYGNLQREYHVKTFGIKKLIHPASFLRILKYRKRCKILHIHWIEAMYRAIGLKSAYPVFAALYLLLLKISKKVLKYRIVITLHNVFPHEIYYPSIEYKAFKESLKLADCIIVHDQSAREIANRVYNIKETRFSVSKHAGWTHFYPTSKINMLKKYDIPENCFIFGNIGKIRRYKGIHLLLEAFKLLKQNLTHKTVKLIVAGDPSEDPDYLKELSTIIRKEEILRKDVILIPRYVDDDAFSSLVLAIDVGVLPYIEVTTPSAALLFLSYSKPIVVSRLKPTEEYCSEGSLFFDSQNVSDLADKMLALLRDSSLYRKLSKAAESYTQKSSWEDTIRGIYEIYEYFNRAHSRTGT